MRWEKGEDEERVTIRVGEATVEEPFSSSESNESSSKSHDSKTESESTSIKLLSFAEETEWWKSFEGEGEVSCNLVMPAERRSGEETPEPGAPTADAEVETESEDSDRGLGAATVGTPDSLMRTSWRIVWYLRSAPGRLETRFGEVAEEQGRPTALSSVVASADNGTLKPSEPDRGLDKAEVELAEKEDDPEKEAEVRDEERGDETVEEAAASFASLASRLRLGFEVSNPPDPMIDSGYFMM